MSAKSPAAPTRGKDGFYTLPDNTRLISVTTILKRGIPKENLVHWSAREVAQCAMDNLPRLSRVRGKTARDETFRWLRGAAETKRDNAAKLGSAIHDIAEAQILGEPHRDATEEERPFVDAFLRFYECEKPEYEATELVVANPADGWAGTLDAAAQLPTLAARFPDVAGLQAVDYKTGNGIYGEASLQLAAYRRATIGWLKNGTQVEPPATVGAVVVHLRPQRYPDTGYRVFPMDTGDEAYAAFLAARDVAMRWTEKFAKSIVGEPFEPESA